LFRSIGEESFRREVFEAYIAQLQEKAKEKERKREEEKVRKSCHLITLLDMAFRTEVMHTNIRF
jgi:hypothetical protein